MAPVRARRLLCLLHPVFLAALEHGEIPLDYPNVFIDRGAAKPAQVMPSASFTEMGPIRFERTTSSLSGTRSNQLSYEPGLVLPAAASRVRSKLTRQKNHQRCC